MQSKRSGKRALVLGLVAILLLSLPLVAGAQTTTTKTTGTAATSGVGVTTNGLAAPTAGQTLSGQFVVRGYANDPNFMKWQLDLLPNGNPNSAAFLALGTTTGVFTYTLDATSLPAGEHVLRLRVVRNDSNYTEYTTSFTIGKAAAGKATGTEATTTETKETTPTQTKEGETKTGTTTTTTGTAATTKTTSTAATSGVGVTTNGLAAPREGQTLSGQFMVKGYANDPNFMKWQLDLLPNGDPNSAAFLALGTTAGVFTYTLDATSLPAGQHALRLRVVRNDSNYTEYTTSFTIGKAAAGKATSTEATTTETKETAPTQTKEGETKTGTTTTTTGTAATTKTTGTATTSGVGVTTNGLAAPTAGQSLSGQFVVKGYANDPNFMKWQLDLLPNGNPNSAAFLALGTTTGAFTYTLNTTGLPAGEHMLRLRVVRNDSNYTEYTTPFKITR